MSKEITFELFQESDAGQVADLMNRNRFQVAKNMHLTADDYLFIQRSRGVCFTVIAKKGNKVIGILGTHPTSIHHVAKEYQVFVGNFLVDIQYRLSYSVIMGLYDGLIKELIKRDYKEILAVVLPENENPYYLMLKCGFVLLDNSLDDFGRLMLRNYTPALSLYAGEERTEVSSNTFFSMLPVVDKKEARKKQGKARLHEKYIECEYILNGKQVTLLYDIVNLKVDGAANPESIKIYPDFHTHGNYIVENLGDLESVSTTFELVMKPESSIENLIYEITLEPGETKVIQCSKEVSELKFFYEDNWYRFHPHLLMEEVNLKEPIKLGNECLEIILEPSTGFISLLENEKKLATLLWPCATFPYIEGVNTPRIKDLTIEEMKDGFVITEETDEYELKRKCKWSGNTTKVTTTLKCKVEGLNIRPLSQVYTPKGILEYHLHSGNKELIFGPSHIKHRGFEYGDFAYLDTERKDRDDFHIESISLKYPTAMIDLVIDNKSKPIIHAPLFTFNLNFDENKLFQEQIIEKMEVYYRTEDG